MDEVLDLLRNGLRRVRSGWCKGQFEDGDGNVCALGAIGYTKYVDASWTQMEARSVLTTIAGLSPLWSWNDRRYRKHEDVIELFEKAIKRRETSNGG